MLIVDKHCSDICCDEFPVPQIDRKNKQAKEQWHGKSYVHLTWGKLAISKNMKIWKFVDE